MILLSLSYSVNNVLTFVRRACVLVFPRFGSVNNEYTVRRGKEKGQIGSFIVLKLRLGNEI